MIRRLLAPSLLLALAACGDHAPAPLPSPVASATSDARARVASLPARQRDGVLFRAIRDAGHDCQEVTESKPQTPANGQIGWLVTCDRADQWLVSIDASGAAIVLGAREAAAAQR